MNIRKLSMRNLFVWAGVCACLFTFRAAAAGPIPDKGLEAAVRQQVFEKRDKTDELTEEDQKKVFILEGKNKGIKDLTGLEKCPNLALINLAGNEIEKVDALKDLKNLQSLDLSKNKIVDIAPLANIKALQFVELSDNQIVAVEALADLPKLSALYIAGNKIGNPAPLGKLTKLSSLDLARNQITDVKDLSGLVPNLMVFKLSGNQIADLSPFAAAAPRMLLLLENNKVTDLAPLVEACKKDSEGEKRFAPFLRLYLIGNPLSDAAKSAQVDALKGFGVKIFLEA
ncbi:MAG: leucine-rich repeat domain-containing protein, partial [Planctomycetota bacterium]|nr:leucine-rich repeat domain-containing protein [Planctomycetota bacterium]